MTEKPAKQLAPKRKPKREADFTVRDKLAILALHVPGLIIGEERNGTTNEILSLIEIDHIVACAFGGGREPQNGRPLRRATGEHQHKSASETTTSAKVKRIARTHQEWWQRVMTGKNEYVTEKRPSRWPKSDMRKAVKTHNKKFAKS